ncbi:MAG: glycine cleavage system aminomethyltransferase GcvT [Nitrososphaerota archaeon]
MTLREPVLFPIHEKSAKEISEFEGWRTPLFYRSLKDEHYAVRNHVGVFDVSHMKRSLIRGAGAAKYLSEILTVDASRLKIGKMKYCLLLNEKAGIIDDGTVLRTGDDEYLLTTNAATDLKVHNWIRSFAPSTVNIEDVTDSTVLLAIQGPRAIELVPKLLNYDVSGLKWFTGTFLKHVGIDIIVTRSGYTGEDGFELLIKSGNYQEAGKIWNNIISLGAVPCGLAARDILRLEASYPLSQVDFDDSTTPVEARLEWAIQLEGHEFVGKKAFEEILRTSPMRFLVGIELEEPGVPRRGMEIFDDTKKVGYITSGNLSPTLKKGIALGYVTSKVAEKDHVIKVKIKDEYREARIKLGPFISLKIPR